MAKVEISAFLLLLGVAPVLGGCAHPQPPEALQNLRGALSNSAGGVTEEVAPELVREARRSLENADAAFEEQSLGRSRWLATLGLTQLRIADAIARQRVAEEQQRRSVDDIAEVEEDLARFRSMRRDAEREIERLEHFREGAAEKR